jgi:hypothetical protein
MYCLGVAERECPPLEVGERRDVPDVEAVDRDAAESSVRRIGDQVDPGMRWAVVEEVLEVQSDRPDRDGATINGHLGAHAVHDGEGRVCLTLPSTDAPVFICG